MRALQNYNSIPEFTDSVKLPVGAYEVEILRAEESGQDDNCALCLLFDISTGEYKNYYHQKFNADRKSYPESAKYKGVFRLWYPNGGQRSETNERLMKTTLERIKQSNNLKVDFSKEWDGALLKGCKVGMVFREQEYNYKGYQGMSVQPYQIITLENLKEGNFKIPDPRYLNGNAPKPTSEAATDVEDIEEEDDLPF